jgi:hypothetical protein
MNEEYFTNTAIDIRIETSEGDVSITDADSVLILYRMPNGTTGEWVAEKFGTQVKYVTSPSDVPTVGGVGTWRLESCAVVGGVRKPGKVCFLTLKQPLN